MNPLTQSKNTTILPLLIALTLGCFWLSPQARAVCMDGCGSNFSTFLGENALANNSGFNNTALGNGALSNNTIGGGNTATGFNALLDNTGGRNDTATGSHALENNTNGSENTATGDHALFANTTGNANTAIGSIALDSNTTGFGNTATGAGALASNTSGASNTATGTDALFSNTGSGNMAIGFNALSSNTTGGNNIALGQSAGANLTTGNSNIDIGNEGVAGESDTIRIGTVGTQTATYIAGIREAPLIHGTAVAVGITADGQLGVRASSARFKDSVKPMDKASEAIFSLQPVTFRYKKDPAALPQFGLVAEEVAKVNPDLVARDVEGKPFTVRYDEINAMLLNEFLKEHRTVQDLKAVVAQQQKQIEALTSGLEKVSAQAKLKKPSPQIVLNNQ